MTNRPKPVNSRHERSTSNAVTSASPHTVKLTRGTGTRDQDKIVAKAKGKTMEDAREDMEILREYIHDPQRTLVRSNPRKKTGNGEGCFCRLSSGGGDHQ